MQSEFAKRFGERLREEMEEKGLTVDEFAKELGCTGVTIRNWLDGRVPFSFHVLWKLREKYEVNLNRLLE